MKKKCIAPLFALLSFLSGCSGQTTNNDKVDMDSLWKKELRTQEKAKHGNKNPSIRVITDATQVAALRKTIEEKIQQAKAASPKKKSLAEAYKSGDKTVVPGIIRILKSNNEDQKKEVLFQLQKRYDDPENYTITEQGIIDEVLNDVDDPVFEKQAVQLAGLNALPGYEKKFQARLLSGRSTDIGRIFFWLGNGKDTEDTKPLDYISQLISTGKLPSDDLDWVLTGLEYYGKKGGPAIRSKVGETSLTIYQARLIPDSKIEELKRSAYTSEAAETLLTCLFEYGDKRVVPIANDILKRKIRIVGPVKALIRLEGPQHLEKVYTFLRSKNDFFTGLRLVESIDRKYVDDRMLKEILIRFAEQKDIQDDQVRRIINTYLELKAEPYLKNVASITSNTAVADRIKKTYTLTRLPVDDIITDLVNSGLISAKPDTAVIRKTKEEAGNEPLAFIYGILASKNIYLAFDSETDMLPLDYDSLLQTFSQNAEDQLKDMLVWTDVKRDGHDGDFTYTIEVLYKNTAFIAHPETIEDWYDMMAVNSLLDKMLERSGSLKRFVSIETGDQTVQYIFGDPAAVQKILHKYKP